MESPVRNKNIKDVSYITPQSQQFQMGTYMQSNQYVPVQRVSQLQQQSQSNNNDSQRSQTVLGIPDDPSASLKQNSFEFKDKQLGVNNHNPLMKYFALGILVVQNTALVLLMRYTLTSHSDADQAADKYVPSAAVFYMELVKLITCLLVVFVKSASCHSFVRLMRSEIWSQSTLLLIIPSFLYAIQNNLLYLALKHLEAPLFQVTYQLKIFTTAMFTMIYFPEKRVTFYGRRGMYKWLALFLLMVGISFVNMGSSSSQSSSTSPSSPSSTGASVNNKRINSRIAVKLDTFQKTMVQAGAKFWKRGVDLVLRRNSELSNAIASDDQLAGNKQQLYQNTLLGIGSVLMACFSSGFAGVYFEKQLKKSNADIWVRNIQLGLFGSFFSFITILLSSDDLHKLQTKGWFVGFGTNECLVVLNQALGGLIVAMVVKYADNILKGFATSVSIILSSLLSILIFGFVPSLSFALGALLVILSVCLYGYDVPTSSKLK
ncbi:hypothetical protein MP228_002905 [Amoeboaphelidium protococcarum]|nr:hypothetical protein MP228_002905 [Amoeboaphelidium protococcarum]